MLSRSSCCLLTQSKNNIFKTLSRAASSASITSNHITTPTSAGSTPSTPVIGTQAPNYPSTWSANQRTRPTSGSGPRFEQTTMEFQPNPLSAMAMIAEEPIRVVEGRKAVCDGGGGPLGHPKIYINLDRPGPRPCGGLRFEQHHHH
ncbi:NADH:ubiquinone oxidoreductase kDa subunit [Lentinula lateritia]|uniref:NADH:ubiquinone oxidoreductase kDa subunit n=1 Tax=Lentinula aff. lateritia TaxID=2804960 RepID=A0ACC1UGN8_9AGAR|nr:NADH:ubiquinone oxidoreductase kDa subunit [Lentinula aff. lateritia]KAJ3857778.1 NADH:ubiquinone oxidoreductase kDa subunit [Lentinula lateritia]